jgi:signal peptidase I
MSVSSEQKRRQGGLAETIRTMAGALIIALVIRTLLFQAFTIPSGSMEATLLVGDYLFVSTYAYGYTHYALPLSPPLFSGRIFGSQPKRGDVVVFRLPWDDSVDYIKRVIGLPGDRIEMIDGRLHINGTAVKRERVEDYVDTDDGYPIRVRRWRETLPNGVSYETLDRVENSEYDNTAPYIVPAGHFFMMGDNRDNSNDSRVPPARGGVGYVPFENILGRAEIIFFSIGDGASAWQLWRWPWSLRWRRLLTVVR